ncbi:galactose-3-O-sulfotransferase 2-like isoform X2 [Branchiostoma floridae x Branchiostoma belcheri]
MTDNSRVDTLKLAVAVTFCLCLFFMLYVSYTPDVTSEFVLLNNRLQPVHVSKNNVLDVRDVIPPEDLGSQNTKAAPAAEPVTARQTCIPKKNFVFIKVQEAASNAVQRILLRYAYRHNLTVMLPRTGGSFHWLTFTDEFDGLPVKDGSYNVIAHHLRYNKEIKTKMPADTVYFTMLQHPVSHMKFSFHQWKLHKHYNISGKDPINVFFKDPYLYSVNDSATFKTHHPIKNRQAFDLGFGMSWQMGDDRTTAHLKEVKKTIRVVLLAERFDESLVLLRRLMCWDMQDILYQPDNNIIETNRLANITLHRKQQMTFQNWSSIDFALHTYSQKTFNETSQHMGPGFMKEVEYFRRLNSWVYFEACKGHLGRNFTHFGVEKSRWHDKFEADGSLCQAIERRRGVWDRKFALRQNAELRKSNGSQLQVPGEKNVSVPEQQHQEITNLRGRNQSIGLKSKTLTPSNVEEKEGKNEGKDGGLSWVGQKLNLLLKEKKKTKKKNKAIKKKEKKKLRAKDKAENIKGLESQNLWRRKERSVLVEER